MQILIKLEFFFSTGTCVSSQEAEKDTGSLSNQKVCQGQEMVPTKQINS